MARSFTRIAVVGAAVATTLVGIASPALAADVNRTISNSHGRMTHIDNVDVFEICDTNADGYGVEGTLKDTFTGHTYFYINDGGDSGCDKKGYDITGATNYAMGFWWSGDGKVVWSTPFQE
ncbi:hypothetical protein [Streptomyces sp. NPDC002994]|uniref:hypothetical protein n=1 Tax=Streptomyces sp. NPDC002994 TaxID=3154441 RepID=UPI0033AAE0CD